MSGRVLTAGGDRLFRQRDDVIDGNSEMLHEFRRGRGIAKGRHAQESAVKAEVFVPAELDAELDGDARLNFGRKYGPLIFVGLLFEEFEARGAHNARLNSFCRQSVGRFQA